MKVSKKASLYFNIVIYLSGTFILLTMLVVISINFFKDARVCAKPAVSEIEHNNSDNEQNTGDNESDSEDNNETNNNNTLGRTQVYTRMYELVSDNNGESEDESSMVKENIKVEVVNYTNIDIYAVQVAEALKSFDFEVEFRTPGINEKQETVILDRSKKYGEKIKRILSIDNLIETDKESDTDYDVTVKIGKDFMPPP